MGIVQVLLLPLLTVSTLTPAQVEIEHDPLSCMSTEEFPIVEAGFDPAELGAVGTAHVYFKASRSDEWYFVDMEPGQNSRLRATLPRPLAETDRVDYYVFVLSETFEPWQSEEYSVYVSESGCGGRRAAAAPPSLTVRATVANQPPVPPGFQPAGISGLVTTSGNTVAVGSAAAGGASGGVSGVVVGGVVAGGAVAGVVVATGGDEGTEEVPGMSLPDTEPTSSGATTATSPSPAPTPAPSPIPPPAPMPSAPDISGTWILEDRLTDSCEPSLIGRTSRTGMTIQQTGTSLSAVREGPNFREDLTGSIDTAGSLTMRGPFVDEDESGESRWNATATSDSEMSGRYSRFYPEHDCTLQWTFTGSKR